MTTPNTAATRRGFALVPLFLWSTCFAQTPAPPAPALGVADAIGLALGHASVYQAAAIGQSVAGEDVQQAHAAFLPRVSVPTAITYNNPERGSLAVPGAQSYISLNAIREYQSGVAVTGELNLSGRLSATLRRNRELLAAARAGTEVARRNLIIATQEAYYGVALTAARLGFADRNVATAQEFVRVTALMSQGGEVPAIDLSRARLQLATRLDEMAQAQASATIATETLRFLTGLDPSATLTVESLETLLPSPGEIETIVPGSPAERPEFTQIEAQRRAANEDGKIARAERRPSVFYTLNAGMDTNSLQPSIVNQHAGGAAFLTLSIPVFDWGISRSKERQAQYRAQTFDLQRQLFERSVTQQLESAMALAAAARQRTQIASGAIVDAQQNVATSVARYRAGESLILEVTDAQNLLTAQQQSLYQAIYEYRIGLARLELAAGVTK